MSLKDIRVQYRGVPDDSTQELRQAISDKVGALIELTFATWAYESIPCGDEDHHTVLFRDALNSHIQSVPEYQTFYASISEAVVTDELRSGASALKAAKRPDLTINVRAHPVAHIEAKIIDRAKRAREYVKSGMERFATGVYGAGHLRGYMLGYLHGVSVDDVLQSIRTTIDGKPAYCKWSDPNVPKQVGKGARFESIVGRDGSRRRNAIRIELVHYAYICEAES
ncbi:hypothetical protein [Mycolicibacterium sp. lyk4-40-TYG-92]|uniref:hypothetical protein n=1 Tax=Mycolicibacterium sp. lyk4-40-TYG-92 TaxID=3040295 RepID=UPI00254E83BB|nr:hypothetical protein [Mycolicibacterium sp. lyk4-40-TYG-92]